MLCVWWGPERCELLKPGEMINTKRYQQQLIDLNCSLLKKRPEYQKRQHKVIFLHDNAPSHTAKPVWDMHSAGKFYPMRLTHQTWLLPITTCLHRWVTHLHFGSYEDVKKWFDEWFAAKGENFYWRGIHKFPERWEKYVTNNGYFE